MQKIVILGTYSEFSKIPYFIQVQSHQVKIHLISPVHLSLKWLNINKLATESIALVLTPENRHKSNTKSLQLLNRCKVVNLGQIHVFHIKSPKTGKLFYCQYQSDDNYNRLQNTLLIGYFN